MIIGPNFVWLHFPKCAGSAVEAALRRIFAGRDDVHFDDIDLNNVIWHQNLAQRRQCDPSFNPSGKLIIACFRRLPEWVVSRVHFEAQRPPHYVASRTMVVRGESYSQNGSIARADDQLGLFFKDVQLWIPVEKIVEGLADTLNIDATHLNRQLRLENKGKFDHIRQIGFWYTQEELKKLYDANPLWRNLERRTYGDLLTV